MATSILSWALALLLGFAAHRASICTVRAVAEILTSGEVRLLLSLAKAALWSLTVLAAVMAFVPTLAAGVAGYSFSTASIAGGLLFGMGAALNRGCAFSTLSRLADGRLRMLATLVGFAAGVLLHGRFAAAGYAASPAPSPAPVASLSPYAPLFAFPLGLWAARELVRLWSTRPSGSTLRELALASQYRLSSAAALIGVGNGVLFVLWGPWVYTTALRQWVESFGHGGGMIGAERISLGLAVVGGMILSAWQRGGFQLKARVRPGWALNLAGGGLMGFGAVLVPGGNDALVLNAIPAASAHALPAFGAMLGGMAIGLVAMERLTGVQMRVECGGDLCKAAVVGRNRSR